MNITNKEQITTELIKSFLEGHDSQERIVNLEYNYQDDFIKVYYRNEKDEKCVSHQPFLPFLWATHAACLKLCDGDRNQLKQLMAKYNIGVKALSCKNLDGIEIEEMKSGYTFMFFAKRNMSYSRFLNFFKEANNPVYGSRKKGNDNNLENRRSSRQYLAITPQEQYLISTGKRFFKGYDDYDQLLRLIFDLETGGLDPKKNRIEQIGIRFNRPTNGEDKLFEKIITIDYKDKTEKEKDENELMAIYQMLQIIYTYNPDIITAHNGENFDWDFIIVRCDEIGVSLYELSMKFFDGKGIYKEERESILKLGGEIEKFNKTIVPKAIVTDSLHAVRRAQAADSNMVKADLKYVTKYSKLNKDNRVYVEGSLISKTWNDIDNKYAFNDENGDWYMITENKPIQEGYIEVSGKYIVERYLLDDLWECDKVEHRYNNNNFLIGKMLPIPFSKVTTMGTAGQWKSIMMAWSYENNLAIPPFRENHSFTGGLSRLLKTGHIANVAKFDYNSLYPSIILSWGITDKLDLMGSMLYFLEYVLGQRELYKGLMKKDNKEAGRLTEHLKDITDKKEYNKIKKQIDKLKTSAAANDKKQLPLKLLGNSFFGSYGCPSVFNWGSLRCAEQTTCTGRMSLRLMISHFNKLGYKPIVGDSFTEDTPLFIKYKHNNCIDIKPILEIINEGEIKIDELGREYDYSEKSYYVLCRSGWHEVEYVYRHKCEKDIYRVSDGVGYVDVTEDHSLFNDKMEKIKPSEIDENTKLEYFTGVIDNDKDKVLQPIGNVKVFEYYGEMVAKQEVGYEKIPYQVYNYGVDKMKEFYWSFMKHQRDDIEYSKTVMTGLLYIKKRIIG